MFEEGGNHSYLKALFLNASLKDFPFAVVYICVGDGATQKLGIRQENESKSASDHDNL